MRRTDTLIVGGGQAGLAMSRCLADREIENVVIERGRVGERWRSERWDSLRLLTPNWQSRLPGWRYQGPENDGYMTMPEVVSFLEGYARSFAAPVEEDTSVVDVEPADSGYRVTTSRDVWQTRNVVVATGQCDVPHVPAVASRLPGRIAQTVPSRYRNPGQLPEGGVLVVGASASGIQLADELERSGRPVTIAVGRHTRLPRTYRGRDIMWWLELMGVLGERAESVFDLEISRRQPSLQLVGRPDRRTLDLPGLQARGVRLVGRVVAADGHRLNLADDLVAHTVAADVKLAKLIARIDRFVEDEGLAGEVGDAEPFNPFFWPADSPAELDLDRAGISSIVWATGYRRRYPWLRVPVLDSDGEIRHRGGVTEAPGLYALGLQFLRRRNSNFIDGVGRDAEELALHIAERSWRPSAVA
jgi:putative flavoprotein involved in K+ transport